MPLLIVLALLVPLVWAAARLTKRTFEEAAPAVLLGLFLLLYVLGWAGLLVAGAWLLRLLWLAAVGYLGWLFVVKRRFSAGDITAGMVLFVALCAALWWLCRGRAYTNWDEYSHWGRALKAVYQQNLLPAVAAMKDEFREYPPALAPFQAAVMKAGFLPFREDVAIYLQGVFAVGLLLYPLRAFAPLFGGEARGAGASARLKNAGFAALAGGLLFLAPAMVFWNYYVETTVDGLLGVLFGFAVLAGLSSGGAAASGSGLLRGNFGLALQCLACAALPLVKASGLLWAVFAWAVVLVCSWVRARPRGPAGPASAAERRRGATAWRVAARCLPLAAALVAQGSWSAYMALHQVPQRWSANGFSLGALWELVAHGRPAWRAEVVRSYFASLFTELNYGWPGGFLPYMAFFVLFIGAWALLRRAKTNEAAPCYPRAFWAMLACGGVYVLGMLLSYLFVFSEYEAVRLASLSRYLNTYLAGMAVFLLGWLAAALPGLKAPRGAAALAGALAVWVLCGNPAQVLGSFVNAQAQAVNSRAVQAQYAEAARAIEELYPEAQSPYPVYVVAIDDLGATLLRMDYELTPGWLPDHMSSIGPAYAEDDLLSLRITVREWAALLAREGYQYVYLLATSDAFAAEFGELFPQEAALAAGELYRVVPGGEFGVKLDNYS